MTALSSAVVMIAYLPSDVTLMLVIFGGSSGVAEIFLLLLAGSISVLPPIYFDILASTNLEHRFYLLNLPRHLQYFLSATMTRSRHHQSVVSIIGTHWRPINRAQCFDHALLCTCISQCIDMGDASCRQIISLILSLHAALIQRL